MGKTESSEEWWDNFPNLSYIINDLGDKKLLKGLCKKWELKVEEFTESHSTEGKFKDLTLALRQYLGDDEWADRVEQRGIELVSDEWEDEEDVWFVNLCIRRSNHS